MSELLRNLSTDSPALWAILVLGVIATLSLGLYGFWETVLRIGFPSPSHKKKRLLRDRTPRSREDNHS